MLNREDIQVISTHGLTKIYIKMTQFIKINVTVFSNFKYKNDIIYKFQ